MTFSVPSMVRVLGLLAVGSTILAVGISRFDPPQQDRRRSLPVAEVNVQDYLHKTADRRSRWVNAQTGEFTTIPVQAEDVLEAASCSPWMDESGSRQVVGRWSSRTWAGPKSVSSAFGLGRYSFPDGRLLNQVHSEVVPVGPPCWFPGTRARILFAAGNGQLYSFAFEPAEPSQSLVDTGDSADQEPVALNWRCAKPGIGDVFIGDISWPTEPRMRGQLVASIRLQDRGKDGAVQYTRTQLWAIRINAAGTEIVAASPLIDHDLSGDNLKDYDERSPVVSRLPDGSLGLAFTRQAKAEPGWSLCLATLAVAPDGRLVPTLESKLREVQRHSEPAPVLFSPDGRWLSALVGGPEEPKLVHRFPTSTRAATMEIPPTRSGQLRR